MSERSPMPASETAELRSTKLALPRSHTALVPREALLARLDSGLEHKLTLLSAPAGFGKTTLARAWIADRCAGPEGLAVAWLSLDADDNDPVRFWQYVVTACRPFDPELGSAALALLRAPRQPASRPRGHLLEAALTAFINALAALPQQCVLVLEDYHAITDPRIHEAVAALVDHLPATLHLMVVTRTDPPLPLARWRAHRDMCELRAADLRFSPEETRAFLRHVLPRPLSEKIVTHVQARTEGWAAGLHLLVLALQEGGCREEPEEFLATFTGGHRHIVKYLVADVFDAQPEPVRTFLLQTSVLDRLTASLCDAVTGGDDAASLLEEIERANLFVELLDEAGSWYRYHPLFAEAMQHEARRRLGETALRCVSQKASLWYEQNGLLAEAVEAALRAEEFARAAVLLERIVGSQSHPNADTYRALHRWLDPLPEEVLRQHPGLCVALAAIHLFVLQPSTPVAKARLEALLEMAEQASGAASDRALLGTVLFMRTLICWRKGDHATATTLGSQALACMPDAGTAWLGVRQSIVAGNELADGTLDAARRRLVEARAFHEAAGNSGAARAMLHLLADVCVQQGELHQAAELYRQVLSEACEDLSDRAAALNGLAELAYAWNDLEAAEQQAQEAVELAACVPDESRQMRVSLVLARVLQARGETAQARQRLYALAARAQQWNSPPLYRAVHVYQAWLSLAEGDLVAVQRWSALRQADDTAVPLAQQEREDLVAARLYIAQGDAKQALHVLDCRRAEARRLGRTGTDLECMILEALAHVCDNHPKEAKQMLVQALALAHSEGYRRLFLDEGQTMAALLRAVAPMIHEEPLSRYVQSLLDAFALQPGEPDGRGAASFPALASLLETLSPQEQRVLQLLAAGHSTPDIAQRLFVSVNTVRTQVRSIYRKLNVNSRVAACEAARRLQLP